MVRQKRNPVQRQFYLIRPHRAEPFLRQFGILVYYIWCMNNILEIGGENMPIYEYRCLDCRRRFNQFLRSFSAIEGFQPVCPHCKSKNARRLVSKVHTIGVVREESDQGPDLPGLEDVDENDPRSMGRWMRRMGAESGEDLGPEFNDVVGRLEAGQDPEQIERDLPNLGGEGMGGGMDGGMGDDMDATGEGALD
jgi:putative FmdB family regulatory protein